MQKVLLKKLLVIMPLICLPAAASFAKDVQVAPGKNIDFTLSCKNGNFVGVVEGTVGRHFQTGPWVHTKRYKITRSNGQQGGNKANVNLNAGRAPKFDRKDMVYSTDNKIQDGQWHELGLSRTNMGIGNAKAETSYEFVFDKSGTDPKCWTERLGF